MSETPKVGVYICHCGGNISDVVAVERAAAAAASLPGVTVARTNMFMCSDAGQGLIAEDLKNGSVNRVVVASCSPRLHGFTFRNTLTRNGMNPYLYEHANIREQVSWVTHADPEAATRKAIKLISTAVAKAKRLEPLEPIRVKAHRHVAVIGGGVSGLKAALDLSRQGIRVTLIEKTPFLGGHMSQLTSIFPTGDGARDLLSRLAKAVLDSPNIDVHTCAEITGVKGHIGDFHLTVRETPRGVTEELDAVAEAIAACPQEVTNEFDYGITNRKAIYQPYEGSFPSLPAIDWQSCTGCGKCSEAAGGKGLNLYDAVPRVFEVRAGVILVATGYNHYEPRRGEYGYGEFAEVITLPQLIRLLDINHVNGGQLEWKGRSINSIAMIHCVGSRQIDGIHAPGEAGELNQYCSRVCCTATLHTAVELRERLPGINIYNFYRDIRTYGRGHENYYEETKDNLFFRFAPESPPVVERNTDGNDCPLIVGVADQLTNNTELEIPVDLVVLSVGMVPQKISNLIDTLKLPVGADRYLQEVHPKLRPVEVAVGGVFLAGTCQGPKDITESCEAASASAAKAAAALSRDYIELDPFVAVVDTAKCNGCGLCVAECSYPGTLYMEDTVVNGKSSPKACISPTQCKGCGACAAVCPTKAISVRGWTLDQFDDMVDALAAG